MVLVEIIIPVADNDGADFSAADFVAFEGELVERFGAFSRLPGKVRGGWAEDGDLYVDDSIVYQIGVPGLIAKAGEFQAVVEFAKRHFRQLAIFVRYLGIAETL